MVTTMVLIVLNASWNFSLGVAGVWNFGQLAIYALGGYGAGILMLHAHLPQWICILLGAAFGALVSVIMALPTLRLFGIYTSLLTFAFAEIVQYAILNDGSGLTGGSYGFPMVNGLFDSMSPDGQMRANYWLVLAVIVITTISLAAITQSSLGIGLRAARDAPAYAASRGLSPIKMRLAAFAISGFLGGLAGALYLVIEQSISPSAMGLTAMSIDVTMPAVARPSTNRLTIRIIALSR
jgi:branched-chain amino acid transport system permease protein